MWPSLIQKAKEGSIDVIETYVFWNAHEPRRREYDFESNLDLIRFIKEVQNAGLYALLRIGPYVCAEWNYGGLPAWLRDIPGMEFRTNNQPFKDEMQNFTTLIVDMVKQERLLAPQGGPIILTQIENEYGNVEEPYGEAGKQYINWCANMAESLDVGVPWIMCQQKDAPSPMINTCNGFYCDDSFTPNNETSPKIWTENWTGWFKAWGNPDEHRPAEDVAYSVALFFQTKGTFMNYYMYHGGTNFGRTSGGPYITTSYDYDAPLDEYGNLRQPKWGHLKELHAALKMMENALVYGEYNWTWIGNGVSVTKFSGENIVPGCLIKNRNETTDATVELEGNKYFVPSWSISILPDCKNEVYNTAKVNVQTTLMTKKPNQAEEEPRKLVWSWKPESLSKSLEGLGGSFTENKLLEQISTTLDVSDYMWYMTSIDNCQMGNMTLHVNTTGHVLYAFVNGHLIGSGYSPNSDQLPFVFEKQVAIKDGKNTISLLSATVGLKNYGAFYEKLPAGIVNGPVELIGGNMTLDLSQNAWSYKFGLEGFDKQLYLESSGSSHSKWNSGGELPTKRPFTWYQTTFQAPLGLEPVVVDLLVMGKGEAWVNGQSLGRFWPSNLASNGGCKACEYKGGFSNGHCQSGCGESSQRWYHVPRSFLKSGKPNTLTLFEEAGGDPSQVNFQTVVVGKICGTVHEGKTLTLSCQGFGRTISSIDFASFGDPQGTCGSFQKGKCEANDVLSAVKNACIGKVSCAVEATESFLGECSTCDDVSSTRLAVQATCA